MLYFLIVFIYLLTSENTYCICVIYLLALYNCMCQKTKSEKSQNASKLIIYPYIKQMALSYLRGSEKYTLHIVSELPFHILENFIIKG